MDFRGASVLMAPTLREGFIQGVTIFNSATSAFQRGGLPPHLAEFVAQARLPVATRDTLFLGGRNLIFNERIVVPGSPMVAAGACVVDPQGAGTLVHGSEASPLFFNAGTAASERAEAGAIKVGTRRGP